MAIVDQQLDLTGLKCPMPSLLLRRALKAAQPGAIIVATATDALAKVDLPFTAIQFGAEVLSVQPNDVGVVVTVRVTTDKS